MVKATFEHEGNSGLLTIITHFGRTVEILCEKDTNEIFRMGGTAVNEVVVHEGLILRLPEFPQSAPFRAFLDPDNHFEADGVLSDEEWHEADRHCYVTEYYPLDMEGQRPGWFISHKPIKDANYLFVNLDILDGVGNVIKRYRVSPFTGEHRVMENVNG